MTRLTWSMRLTWWSARWSCCARRWARAGVALALLQRCWCRPGAPTLARADLSMLLSLLNATATCAALLGCLVVWLCCCMQLIKAEVEKEQLEADVRTEVLGELEQLIEAAAAPHRAAAARAADEVAALRQQVRLVVRAAWLCAACGLVLQPADPRCLRHWVLCRRWRSCRSSCSSGMRLARQSVRRVLWSWSGSWQRVPRRQLQQRSWRQRRSTVHRCGRVSWCISRLSPTCSTCQRLPALQSHASCCLKRARPRPAADCYPGAAARAAAGAAAEAACGGSA